MDVVNISKYMIAKILNFIYYIVIDYSHKG